MSQQQETIAFIGLGNMGLPMASNLLDAGYKLRVFNRTADKAQPLISKGAVLCNSPRETIVPGCIVVTMLLNDATVTDVVCDAETGFLQVLGEGGIHVSCSTISPATSKKLASLHSAKGATYVTATVLGRPSAAANRNLAVLVSGLTQEIQSRVTPILQVFGPRMFDLGSDVSAANTVKLCLNFSLAAQMETLAEALALAEKSGVDREQAYNVISSLLPTPVLNAYGKWIADRNHRDVGFYLANGLKDATLFCEAAHDVQAPMPIANLLQQRCLSALAKGWGHLDWSAFTLMASSDAGIDVSQAVSKTEHT